MPGRGIAARENDRPMRERWAEAEGNAAVLSCLVAQQHSSAAALWDGTSR